MGEVRVSMSFHPVSLARSRDPTCAEGFLNEAEGNLQLRAHMKDEPKPEEGAEAEGAAEGEGAVEEDALLEPEDALLQQLAEARAAATPPCSVGLCCPHS